MGHTAKTENNRDHRRRWRDLGRGERVVTVALGATQLALALVAWGDLAERPAQLVRGRKGVWAAVIAINFLGPILYLKKGRIFPRVP